MELGHRQSSWDSNWHLRGDASVQIEAYLPVPQCWLFALSLHLYYDLHYHLWWLSPQLDWIAETPAYAQFCIFRFSHNSQ